MGILDAQLQYIIFIILLPSMFVFIIVRWYFDFTPAKLRTWLSVWMLKNTHKKLEYEKKLLFGHVNRMTNGNSLSANPKNIPLTVLEIGVGSGRNFSFYPKGATVTCLEPDDQIESYIRESMRKAKKNLKLDKIVKGFAEDMRGIDDNSFDIVICTMTLCTVRNPDAALNEVRRVLKPGGKFFFLEHVAASKSTVSRWIQDKLQRVWSFLADGCQANREIWVYLDRAHFSEVSYQHFKGSIWFVFLRSWMYGIATK